MKKELLKYITYIVTFNVPNSKTLEQVDITGDKVEKLLVAVNKKQVVKLNYNWKNTAYFVSCDKAIQEPDSTIMFDIARAKTKKLQQLKQAIKEANDRSYTNEKYEVREDISIMQQEVEELQRHIKEIEDGLRIKYLK